MTLADIALKKYGLVDGPFGSNLPASDYTSEGIPVIRGANLSIGAYRFKDENYVYVSEETAKRLHKCACLPDDIIFTKKGTIGQVGIVPINSKFKNFILSSNQMRLRLDKTVADPLFTYYYLSSPTISQKIIMESVTTGVPKINLGYLKKFQVFFPQLQTQSKIASILSAYDELFENNKQRIKLLEEMAEEIYKEWFVRLRFPGYETAKFVDGLPEGWKDSRLETICDFQMGQSPSSEFYNDNGIGLPFHQGVTNFNSRFPNHVSYCTDLKSIADEGDILLSVRAPVGRINIATEKLIIGRGLSSVKHKNGLPNYCYYLLKEIFKKEDSFGNGSVFNAVTKSDLLAIKSIEPYYEVCEKFQELIKPMDEEIKTLTDKNQLLQQTRYLLLPRLISGKLSVEHLVEAEESMSIAAEPKPEYK